MSEGGEGQGGAHSFPVVSHAFGRQCCHPKIRTWNSWRNMAEFFFFKKQDLGERRGGGVL